jgi:hypothetical protein
MIHPVIHAEPNITTFICEDASYVVAGQTLPGGELMKSSLPGSIFYPNQPECTSSVPNQDFHFCPQL